MNLLFYRRKRCVKLNYSHGIFNLSADKSFVQGFQLDKSFVRDKSFVFTSAFKNKPAGQNASLKAIGCL